MNPSFGRKIAAPLALTAGVLTLALAAPALAAPTNDNLALAETIGPGLPAEADGTLEEATHETGENAHAGEPADQSIWYAWTPGTGGAVLVDACPPPRGSAGPARVGVYTGTAFPLAAVPSSPRADSCRRRLTASSDQTYMIALDVSGPQSGETHLEIRTPLANDDFADRQVLAGALPISVDGDTTGATAEPDELDHVVDTTGKQADTSLWYEWTPAGTGEAAVDLCGGGGFGNNGAAVYTGDQLDGLTRIAGSEDDECLIRFDATAGTSYKLAVDNNSRPADFTLQIDQAVEPPPDAGGGDTGGGDAVVQGLTSSIQDAAQPDSGKKPGKGKKKKKKRKQRP